MPPIAVPKSIDLFNRAAELKLGDVEQAMQLRFQLLPLLKRQPGDPMVRIALIYSCMVAGFRDEAIENVEAVGPLIRSAGVPERLNYAMSLAHFGRPERALLILSKLFDDEQVEITDRMRNAAALSAYLAGDLAFLERLADQEALETAESCASSLLSVLDDLKLRSALPAVQRVVLETMADVQMDAGFKITEHPDDGRRFLSFHLYVDASKVHRLDVADALNDRLTEVFADYPEIRDDWWWRLMVTVHAAPRHASLPAAPRTRLAA